MGAVQQPFTNKYFDVKSPSAFEDQIVSFCDANDTQCDSLVYKEVTASPNCDFGQKGYKTCCEGSNNTCTYAPVQSPDSANVMNSIVHALSPSWNVTQDLATGRVNVTSDKRNVCAFDLTNGFMHNHSSTAALEADETFKTWVLNYLKNNTDATNTNLSFQCRDGVTLTNRLYNKYGPLDTANAPANSFPNRGIYSGTVIDDSELETVIAAISDEQLDTPRCTTYNYDSTNQKVFRIANADCSGAVAQTIGSTYTPPPPPPYVMVSGRNCYEGAGSTTKSMVNNKRESFTLNQCTTFCDDLGSDCAGFTREGADGTLGSCWFLKDMTPTQCDYSTQYDIYQKPS